MNSEYVRLLVTLLTACLICVIQACSSPKSLPPTQGPQSSSPSLPGTGSPSLPGSPPSSSPQPSPSPPSPSDGSTGSGSGDKGIPLPSSDLPDPTAKSGSSKGESGGDEGAKDSEDARRQAGDKLKKAGDKIAKAGEKLGSSGSKGKEDELAGEDSGEGDIAGGNADGNGDDPLSEDVLAAQEALREALEEAGVALEEAGEMLESAATEEEMIAAAEALARARVVVIVTAEELEKVLESEGEDAEDDPLFEETREALYDANLAIVIGGESLHILDALPDLPEEPYGSEENPSGENTGKINDLDSELDEALVVFDSTIQDARGKITESGSAPASPQINTMPGKVSRKTSDTPAAGAPGAGGAGKGNPQEVASLPSTPDDLPSAQDDDIVAKQLREAAVAESDPELRDKLWDEYRRYKEGSAN